jgi:hypothetical protein
MERRKRTRPSASIPPSQPPSQWISNRQLETIRNRRNPPKFSHLSFSNRPKKTNSIFPCRFTTQGLSQARRSIMALRRRANRPYRRLEFNISPTKQRTEPLSNRPQSGVIFALRTAGILPALLPFSLNSPYPAKDTVSRAQRGAPPPGEGYGVPSTARGTRFLCFLCSQFSLTLLRRQLAQHRSHTRNANWEAVAWRLKK